MVNAGPAHARHAYWYHRVEHGLGASDAHMLQRQGPTERAKIAFDREIFRRMRICVVPTTKRAGIDVPVAAPALGCMATS